MFLLRPGPAWPEMMRVPSQTHNCLYTVQDLTTTSNIFQSFPAHNGSSDFHPPWRTTKSWPSAISTAVGWKKAGLGVVQSPARFSANIPNCFQTASKLLPNCFQMPNASKNSAISFHFIPFLFVCLVQGATAELDRADSRLMSLSWAGLMYVNA